MNIGYIRKVAELERGRSALDELTAGPTTPLDDVFLHKAASAEDPELLRIAEHMGGDPLANYENLGGTFKKQAFGTPMFQASAAPDPVVQAAGVTAGLKSPTSAPSGPRPPSSRGSAMGGGSSVPSSVPQPSAPSISGAAGQGAGSQ